ncbi:MAG: DNA-directed RNA polymerase subunit omega [Bacteroidales bacterium]|jgi:DNA-directed RNA polymerase subunit K/omega|nr:DNA-directed RNA polymerase subunit omega [Bacteroidales bacterium]
MDYKKTNASQDSVTRNIQNFDEATGNIYETIAVLSKRANQISAELKDELQHKISEYSHTVHSDNMDDIFENREQIEIAKYYETIPKSTLLATQELIEDKIYFRDPAKELEF